MSGLLETLHPLNRFQGIGRSTPWARRCDSGERWERCGGDLALLAGAAASFAGADAGLQCDTRLEDAHHDLLRGSGVHAQLLVLTGRGGGGPRPAWQTDGHPDACSGALHFHRPTVQLLTGRAGRGDNRIE